MLFKESSFRVLRQCFLTMPEVNKHFDAGARRACAGYREPAYSRGRRCGVTGVWGAGEGGGSTGWKVQTGSVYKQPERKEGSSCHIWREPSKWKGTQRGKKGELAGGARGAKGIAPCIYACAGVIEPLE